jgi:hypothetical protein
MENFNNIVEAYQFAMDNYVIIPKTFLEDVRVMREVQDEYDTLLENLERDYGKEYLMFADDDEIAMLDFLYARKYEYEKRVDDFLKKK